MGYGQETDCFGKCEKKDWWQCCTGLSPLMVNLLFFMLLTKVGDDIFAETTYPF
jgi:hypothetical protein